MPERLLSEAARDLRKASHATNLRKHKSPRAPGGVYMATLDYAGHCSVTVACLGRTCERLPRLACMDIMYLSAVPAPRGARATDQDNSAPHAEVGVAATNRGACLQGDFGPGRGVRATSNAVAPQGWALLCLPLDALVGRVHRTDPLCLLIGGGPRMDRNEHPTGGCRRGVGLVAPMAVLAPRFARSHARVSFVGCKFDGIPRRVKSR